MKKNPWLLEADRKEFILLKCRKKGSWLHKFCEKEPSLLHGHVKDLLMLKGHMEEPVLLKDHI